MKLIIDIPEKVVTSIQNGEDYRFDIHTAIAQGIPCEEKPQGDLISREALRKHAIWTKVNNGVELIDIEVVPLDVIDNAPTVEIATKLQPKQGEWKLDSLGAYCSECGTHPDYSSNYCPNCGASMKCGNKE